MFSLLLLMLVLNKELFILFTRFHLQSVFFLNIKHGVLVCDDFVCEKKIVSTGSLTKKPVLNFNKHGIIDPFCTIYFYS